MPADRVIEIGFKATAAAKPSRSITVWADRQNASADRIFQTLGSVSGETFVDYRTRWRQDLESTIPGLLQVTDNSLVYQCEGISFDDARRSFVTLHCRRGSD